MENKWVQVLWDPIAATESRNGVSKQQKSILNFCLLNFALRQRKYHDEESEVLSLVQMTHKLTSN